ncbi:ecdysone-induced protein 75B [Rhodamnia argentea]|uniref:Ecdysone-induced protein 75B n=1 Tax=Rhodamnia argentea TaxID=178133 RepID=A0A8B8PK08_9MYRT|nr:ecdysone-induced protein 75B [Rhodamnia argentea]
MDPPPLPPLSTATVATAASIPLSYPDSLDSPRDGAVDDDPLPPKLRLMCSFGGHIIPRPHDKSLCYVGGETRIVVVDRHSSLADLSARLSRALLHGRPFALKYQLPTEDLDSLISVTNDEDLLNMIDEYDRAASPSPSPLRPSRLRLFLFFTKPETATSMGTLLDDSKSETWFVDALNHAGILPRGLSDSATGVDCLVNLDPNHDPPNDLEAQIEDHNNSTNTNDNSKQVKAAQDVQFAMPDSPVVENSSSSHGSSSSSPSMSNLPPIRVSVDQRTVGIDDQFAQMSIAANHLYRHDDGYGAFSALAPPFPSGIMASAALNAAASASMANQASGCGENMSNRAVSDDERSDQGAPPMALRKPPLPMLQPVQVQPLQHKASAAYNLPSPDSVASDSSIASASSLSRPMYYEDQSHVELKEQRRGPFSPTPGTDPADPTPQAPIPQAADPSYAPAPPSDHLPPLPPQPPPPQPQQQQFVHMSTHYIPHPAQSQSPVLVSPYYPVYQMQSQQQQLHHPVYVMPDGSVVGQARPLPTSSPSSAQPAGGYKDLTAPIYHAARTPGQVTPEMASSMYNSYMASHQPLIQVPAGQYQRQHAGMMAQINQQPQPAGGASNHAAFDYSYSAHDLAYYSQHQASALTPQYQNLANASTVADPPKQPSGDNA